MVKNKINLPYISIDEFSNIIGISKITLTFQEALNNLINIGKLQIYKLDSTIVLNKNEIDDYFSNHISYNKIIESCGISPQTLRRIIRNYNIPSDIFGSTYEQKFISKVLVKIYFFNNGFVSCFDIIEMLQMRNSEGDFPKRAYNGVLNYISKDDELSNLLGYQKLNSPIFFNNVKYPQYDVFDKEKVRLFFSSHISTKYVLNDFNLHRNNLLTFLKRRNIQLYSFYERYEYKFITRDDFKNIKADMKLKKDGYGFLTNKEYTEMLKSGKYLTRKEIISLLKITRGSVVTVLSQYGISPDKIIKVNSSANFVYLYCKEKILNLLKLQDELKSRYEKQYYTWDQIKEIFEVNGHSITLNKAVRRLEIEVIECPLLLRSVIGSSHAKLLYNKIQVLEYIESNITKKLLSNINMNSPFEEFKYKTESILKVSFTLSLSATKDLWYQYVKFQLQNTTSLSIKNVINQFAKVSLTLSTLITKEIFNYKTNSLNNIFFNENSSLPNKHQCIIYDFLINVVKSISEKSQLLYDLKLLVNPHRFRKGKVIDTSRYSFEEYNSLYLYSSDLSIHKLKAINAVESLLKGEKYTHYDSYWVYVLTHLTNNWRHSTIVTQIPEIVLPDSNNINLEWLKQNNLRIEDANTIIFQIGRKIQKISKTDALIEFRIAEPLKIPFATAIYICQLRANLYKNTDLKNETTGPLLWISKLNTIQPKHIIHKLFFEQFIPDFKFLNRKMNKTLTTLIWSVFKSLKTAQFSRSHFSEDSTIYYVKLSDEQLEELVNLLFERNSFGYISQLLAQKIFENNTLDRVGETNKMLTIYKEFGDVHKIEVTTGLLNQIAKNQDDVLYFINDLTSEEAKNILMRSMTNTLYSKEKYYQCVFVECKFNASDNNYQDCLNCPFSIINVYAITNIIDLYIEQIYKLIEKFDSAKIGEKKKLANHFYLLWRQIQIAKSRFGDSIYTFIDGGKEKLNSLSHQLPRTKKYLSSYFNE